MAKANFYTVLITSYQEKKLKKVKSVRRVCDTLGKMDKNMQYNSDKNIKSVLYTVLRQKLDKSKRKTETVGMRKFTFSVF